MSATNRFCMKCGEELFLPHLNENSTLYQLCTECQLLIAKPVVTTYLASSYKGLYYSECAVENCTEKHSMWYHSRTKSYYCDKHAIELMNLKSDL